MLPKPKQNAVEPTQTRELINQPLDETRFGFQNAENAVGLLPGVCRVCLSMNVRLHHMSEPGLSAMYARVVGVQINTDDMLPRHLCWECVGRMSSANRFRQKAFTTQWILKEKITNSRLITISDIESIDKAQHKLESTLGTKLNTVNEYDYLFSEETVEANSCSDTPTSKSAKLNDLYEIEINFCEEKPIFIKEEFTSEEDPINTEHVAVNVKVEALDYTTAYEDAGKHEDEDTDTENIRISSEEIAVSIKRKNKSDEEVSQEDRQVVDRDIDVLLEDIVTANAYQSTKHLIQNMKNKSFTSIKNKSIFGDDSDMVTELSADCIKTVKLPRPVINIQGSTSHNIDTNRRMTQKKKKLIGNTDNQQKLFICDICDRSFQRKPSLIQHLQKHPKIHYCTYCTYKGSKKKILLKHINVKHTKSEVFNCPHCSYKAYQKWDLSVHINAKHTKTISFNCPHCSYTAYRKGHLSTHINTKHTKSEVFKCNQCSYKAYRKSLLSRHVDVKHTKNVLFDCAHCNYKAYSKAELLRHVNTKHKKIKVFNCPHCSYDAYQKSDLSKHVNAKHTKSEIFSCPHCSFETYLKSGLASHLNNKHTQ